jgi:hypothetical protein
MARPAEIAQIDVYDTHNRTLTYLSFEGPLAELIATRCIETIGRTITSCQLVASSDIGIRGLGFVPSGYEEIREGNMDRRLNLQAHPRGWAIEADDSLAAEYKARTAEDAAPIEAPGSSHESDAEK